MMYLNFMEERNEALISGDYRKLRDVYIRSGIRDADKAPDRAMEIILHKNRLKWDECPAEQVKESLHWMMERGKILF